MRTSNILIATMKETPADAEIISHKLMLRAGLVRKLASGLYSWLPMGLRVLRKVEKIIREEMDKTGAQEVLMPVTQPAGLWEQSGRWGLYGAELLRFRDRHDNEFCLGPTHEEVITNLVQSEIRSYKQLPITFYQIQTKFRDEIRPRFGIMRAREFTMKDAYSFHLDEESLQQTYDVMFATYTKIFQRLGLTFRAVQADNGSIGGHSSHEFHVMADSGEDEIAWCKDSDYAANVELNDAKEGDPSPDGKGSITISRGIEVGHIFQLGKKYSEAMKFNILGENGKALTPTMGCYGIGVSRIVAAAIEQNHDDKGIMWPLALAPFEVVIIPVNMAKSHRLRETCEALYETFKQQGFDVLLDDRKSRPGFMFADMELIGIPHRFVLSDKGLDKGTIEYRGRSDEKSTDINSDNVVDFLREKLVSND